MGAGKWRDDYAESLRGAGRVVVLSDDDDPGREHAERVARSLSTVVEDVRVVELWPRGKSGADVSDWIGAAKSEDERRQARLLLEEIVTETPALSISPPIGDEGGGNESVSEPSSFSPCSLESLIADAPPEPEWRFRGYLAPGTLTLCAGRPKVGKSTFVFALIARLVAGQPFAGLETAAEGVLLLSEERRDTLAEKARASGLVSIPPLQTPIGAETNRRPVHVVMRHETGSGDWPSIVRQAMAYCHQNGLGVLVIDTWDRWVGLRGELENAAGAVNEALEPLLYAAASGLAVLIVSHQRKSQGEWGEAVRGSNALTGGVDIVAELERAPASLKLSKHARVLRAVSRFASTPEELFVELDEGGAYTRVDDPEEAKAAADQTRVLELLTSLGETTAEKIAEEAELPEPTVRRYLNVLRDRGHAVRTGKGRRGDPYRWRAADEEPEP